MRDFNFPHTDCENICPKSNKEMKFLDVTSNSAGEHFCQGVGQRGSDPRFDFECCPKSGAEDESNQTIQKKSYDRAIKFDVHMSHKMPEV